MRMHRSDSVRNAIPHKLFKVLVFLFLLVTSIRVSAAVRKNARKRFYRKHVQRLHNLLQEDASILDVGSGTGTFSDILQNAVSAQVMCTDVVDHHVGKTVFIRGNGDRLPFPAQSFDTVTLLYVLHHTDHPEMLLREARRISRKRVIIHEDAYSNHIEKLWLIFHIASFKFVSPQSGFTLKTDQEWEALFKEIGFQVDKKYHITDLGYPVTRYEYLLTPMTNHFDG
jgi:ubiquinone/menaquinone biosynthesis C-methylase UbiE